MERCGALGKKLHCSSSAFGFLARRISTMGLNWSCTLSAYLDPETVNRVPRVFYYLLSVLKAVAVAVVVAPIITWLYGWRVTRLMARRGDHGSPPTDPPASASHTGRSSRRDPTLTSLGDGDLSSWGESLISEAQRCERDHRMSIVYSTLAFAVTAGTIYYVLTVMASTAPKISSIYAQAASVEHGREAFFVLIVVVPLLGWLLQVGLFTGMAWPMVLLGMRHPRLRRWLFWLLPVYIFVLAGPLVTGVAKWSDGGYWIFAAPLCLLLIGLGSRHQRNAVPMLTGAVLIPLLLWEEGNAYARALSHCNPLKDIPHADLGLMLALVIAMAVVIALAGLFGGIVALRALASAYHRKYYSDAQFQMLSWFALLAILFAIVLFQPRTNANDVLLIAIPVAVFAFVYVRSTRRLSPSRQAPPLLLLLRVFGDSSQREQLLDEVSRYWRFIGPICLIGGPDLAKANLEPHELLAFVALRTERGFITDDASLAQRLDEIDREADPDSRYRVNEFYCTDRMWVKAVEELIHRSNAVLIDLRGFAAARAGTAIELSLLSRMEALDKTTALVGENTDMAAVEAAIGKAWAGERAIESAILRNPERLGGREIFARIVGRAIAQVKNPTT